MQTEAPTHSPVAAESTQRLFELAYQELHRIAHRQRQRVGALATLNTTALVHEVYLKLSPYSQSQGLDRRHFLALTARAMRQVLIDHSRSRVCLKRGGEFMFTEINENHQDDATGDMADMLALDQSLNELAEIDARAGQVVEWHIFGGLGFDEIAELQGITVRTVCRDWRRARAFLVQRLSRTNRVAQQ
jgi:RNA polymerase sigma factor (TIGR02999 family)